MLRWYLRPWLESRCTNSLPTDCSSEKFCCRFLQRAGKRHFFEAKQTFDLPTIHFRLGGVHRGGENSKYLRESIAKPSVFDAFLAMDVSADLHELTRCPVGLVSAGVKSILDIGKFVVFYEYTSSSA